MAKKSLGDYLVETGIEYVFIFVGMCILGIPMAIITGGVESASGLIFIVMVAIFCILMDAEGDKKSQTKSKPNNNQNKNNKNRDYHPKIKKCPVCGMSISYIASGCPWCNLNEKKSAKESSAYLKQETQGKQNSKKKICPNCKKEVSKYAMYCNYCKTKFDIGNAVLEVKNNYSNTPKTDKHNNKKKSTKKCSSKLKNRKIRNGYARCNNCGREILDSLNVCPFCDSKDIVKNSDLKKENRIKKTGSNFKKEPEKKDTIKTKPIRFRKGYARCNNCGREILESLDVCPHCNSKDLSRLSSGSKNKFNKIKIHDNNIDKNRYNLCKNCGRQILKVYGACPHCGSKNIEKF